MLSISKCMRVTVRQRETSGRENVQRQGGKDRYRDREIKTESETERQRQN